MQAHRPDPRQQSRPVADVTPTVVVDGPECVLHGLDENQWPVYTGSLHTRPIMSDFMLREMREQDRRAIYRFIRSLGPAGEPAPAALPPGQTPPMPYFQLVAPPPPEAAATAAGQNGQNRDT